MNHLDTVGKLEEIKLCVGYKDSDGQKLYLHENSRPQEVETIT